jgi:predicted DsbA family dithiol-disulfide isomerase
VDLNGALEGGLYSPRIQEATQEAARYGINAVPTFIINDTDKIVGALPLETFRERLKRIHGG